MVYKRYRVCSRVYVLSGNNIMSVEVDERYIIILIKLDYIWYVFMLIK